ncbi:glycerophosphodiester phosphodiesterase [Arcobacter sp.]|uniref:glycerophosphodiester phosphodiesterase n=1 Tax=unclassified Arcobacter TaxID=2593671 RepID=UPI003B003B2C
MNFWDNFGKDEQLLIAHRGLRSLRAENTMAAFKQVIGKYQIVEFDVTFTKDGIAIIIHDDTLERTSNVKEFKEFKKPYKVADYTYEQLLKLDFSSWFIKTPPFKTIKENKVSIEDLKKEKIEKIPTLKEVLLFLKQNNIFANIEIKDLENTNFHEIAAKEVLKIVDETKMQNKVIISSFNHVYLKQIHDINPSIETAALQEKEHPKDLINYLKSLNVKNYNCDFEITDEALVKKLNDEGFYVNVYTLNQKEDIEKLFKWGVKSIFTDY